MKVALFYAHAASNWGDLAINKGVVNLLQRMGHNLETVHGVRLPHNTIHTLNSDVSLKHLRIIPVEFPVEAASGLGTLIQAYEYLTDIEKFISDFGIDTVDMVLLNSGEHLFENAEGTNIGDLAWRILPLIAGAHAQVPVTQLPATVGPFHTQRVIRLFRLFLSNLHAGAVRDGFSKGLVGTLGRSMEEVLDPGFFGVDLLPVRTATDPKKAIALIPRLEDFGLRAGTRRSAYVLAKNRDARYEGSKAFQVYLHVAEEILKNSSDTVHLIVQTWADRELIHNLYTALAELDHGSRVWLHDPTDYDTFTGSLADMDVVVTSRFHAAILALTQGVPAVGIYSDSHGHKMPGLFSMLGFPKNSIRLQDRLTETVVDEINQAVDFSKKNTPAIYESVVSWRALSEKWFRNSITSSTKVSENRKLATTQEVDQIRIDLLYELHGEILRHNQEDDHKNILSSLRNIENLLSKA